MSTIADTPIAVTVVGGYLGSGKTTVINHLLRHADGKRLAVLVNEFGELPIDADLIESADENVISITGGCVCCSYGSDLMGALMELPKLGRKPDCVLIEASGVALPGAIASAVGLLPNYRLDSVSVLADAETVERQSRDKYIGDTIERQLAAADIVILNKSDLVPSDSLAGTERWVERMAPAARVLATARGEVPPALLLGFGGPGLARAPDAPAPTQEHHSTEAYTSFALEVGPVRDPEFLAQRLATAELGLLRTKGFIDTEDKNGTIVRQLLQVVGRRWQLTPAPADEGPARLVCIGYRERVDESSVRAVVSGAGHHHERQHR